MSDQKVLAVITARGGSKRIPQKNLRKLGNQTLIERTVGASLRSRNVDRSILSSDCPKIIREAINHGCDVPFIRPAELATDLARSEDVIEHAIKSVPGFDWVLILQPTSPFRTAEDIDLAFELVQRVNRSSCVGVRRVEPQLSRNDQHLFNGDVFNSFAQKQCRFTEDSAVDFILNGAIYLIKTSCFLSTKKIMGEKTIGIEMSAKKSIDVDNFADLRLASQLVGN